MSTAVQLRIAARIHFILKRDLGEGINVAAMLSDPTEAREVLFVCQASGNAELVTLARQFVHAGKVASPSQTPPSHHDQPTDTGWGRTPSDFGTTTGFGATTSFGASTSFGALPAAATVSERSWRSATEWLRRSTGR